MGWRKTNVRGWLIAAFLKELKNLQGAAEMDEIGNISVGVNDGKQKTGENTFEFKVVIDIMCVAQYGWTILSS